MFRVDGMHRVCGACRLEKQPKGSFPHENYVCKRPLKVVHIDVLG